MQHIWKVLLTSLLIFALAATACLAEDSEAQYQAYPIPLSACAERQRERPRHQRAEEDKNPHSGMDDAWCKVQVGNKVGYAKPEWLYRVQSLDALHYPLQNLPHRMSGYVEFSAGYADFGRKIQRLHRVRRANRLCGSTSGRRVPAARLAAARCS